MDGLENGLAADVEKLAKVLVKRKWMMATAESCTGGAIATALTEAPGASHWFAGALVSYATEWKCRYLGVSEMTVERHGVASCEVVGEMLRGLAEHFGVQACCAVSGIAGPDGGEPGKPVGTVYIGAWCANGRAHVRKCHFSGNRTQVRSQAVASAVAMLLEVVAEC